MAERGSGNVRNQREWDGKANSSYVQCVLESGGEL